MVVGEVAVRRHAEQTAIRDVIDVVGDVEQLGGGAVRVHDPHNAAFLRDEHAAVRRPGDRSRQRKAGKDGPLLESAR